MKAKDASNAVVSKCGERQDAAEPPGPASVLGGRLDVGECT